VNIGREREDRTARRILVLTDLIQCRRLPSESRLLLRDFDWDSDPLVVVSTVDVSAVLQLFISGTVASNFVEDWAESLESRDDVDFVPSAKDAIHVLANPALEGDLNLDLARELLAALHPEAKS